MLFLRRRGVVVFALAASAWAGCSSDAPEYALRSRHSDVAVSLGAGEVIRINFQDESSPAPGGHLRDFGEPYGERALSDQGQLTFGWVAPGTNTPVDLSSSSAGVGNGRNRGAPGDARLATLMHMQAAHLLPGFAGTRQNGAWQLALEDGSYTVALSVGDGVYLDSTHGVSVEGVEAISGFAPTEAERFRAAEVEVFVADGALTIDATGVNTKLNYVEIRAADTPCAAPEVTTLLPCSRLTARAPYRGDFGAERPGLGDAAGASTGFAVALATGAGAGHVPEDLRVDQQAGELAITTRAGIAAGTINSQLNALGVGIPLPNGVFRMETELVAPPQGSGAYEQAGIWFGKSQREFAKLVLISAPGGLVMQVSLEQGDVLRSAVDMKIDVLPERPRLAVEVDPTLRELRGYVTLAAGQGERLVGILPDVPEDWLGLVPGTDPALPSAYAGVFATHRNRAAELGPLTYRFGEFSVAQRAGLSPLASIDGARWRVAPAFPDVTFVNPTNLVEAPGTGHVFVTEREGRVYAVPLQSTGAATKKLVLDLSAVSQGYNDLGLLGLAFHPEFGDRSSPNAGYMYLHYPYTPTPAPPPVPLDWPTESRLARFSVDLDTLVADPASELVLIAQQDDHIWHQGGAMFFHPEDGFLYLAVGDGGGSLCSLGNCQRIDRDLFAGVLRIDVDMRGGDISHPISRQPERGATAHYYIPNDNPFVGEPGVLEEFYALGLRSPHRMTHDPVDGITWIGDVGQNQREELDVLAPAANYQWNYSEGTFQRGDMSEVPHGVWTDPVLELHREESVALIGGYVYRGTRLPDLFGKYIFGDYTYGTIWALDYAHDGVSTQVLGREQLLTTLLGRSSTLTSFGVDSSGELYLLSMGQASQVQRLERGSGAEALPARLSQLGAFENPAALIPVPTAIPYSVRSPLFSDGTSKRRWLLPAASGQIGFSENGPFRFPEGTVFVKHFELALDERRPEQRRKLETRFLVAAAGGAYYGITYKWNAAGTDAEPVLASELEDIEVVQADGSVRRQSYFYPGPNECMVCHNENAGYVLGVRTAQLNGALDATGGEPLIDWSERGLLDTALDADALAALPSLAPLDDESRSLEDRVRSYWDGNCSMCHGVMNDIRSTWDARYQTPLADQGVIYGTLSSDADVPEDAFVVTPGDPSRSAIWLRDRSTEPGLRMPPLGRQRVDDAYIDLLERWIASL